MRVALALLGLAAVLSLTACGNSVSLGASVANAAVNTTAKGSEHVTITGFVTANGQKTQISGSGDFQSAPALGEATLTLDGGPANGTITEVTSGTSLYVKSSLFASILPSGKSWVGVDLAKASQSAGLDLTQFAQASPAEAIAALEQAGSVKKVGSDTIGGVATTHYRAVIQLKKAGAIPVDVWVDGNGMLKRLSENGPVGTASTSVTMTFSNYGEQVNVHVPSAAETVDMSKLGG